jgi:hypothetical protein
MTWPEMIRVEQQFDHPHIPDCASAAVNSLAAVVADTPLDGASVALTVGSRGITNLPTIIRALVGELLKRGAEPFIVPAMGSHGGGTAEGQESVLRSLDITEDSVGAPIRSSMDTVEVGRTEDNFPVVIDRVASEAHHILVVNRIKPHTEFFGPYQSGLMKMLLIGLGKHRGALNYHQAATHIPFEQLIRTAGTLVIERTNILAGIAILENGHEQTAEIVGVHPQDFLSAEGKLIERATAYLPMVPFGAIDLLIIDEMGKNISGSGIDTNVIRRKHWADLKIGESLEPDAPCRIFVRDLTDKSDGNAAGVGLADFTLDRVAEKYDRHKTYTNTITATRPRGAMLPLTFATDREAIEQALLSAGISDMATANIARIRNTLQLVQLEVTKSLMDHTLEGANVRELGPGGGISFDDAGMLTPDKLDV